MARIICYSYDNMEEGRFWSESHVHGTAGVSRRKIKKIPVIRRKPSVNICQSKALMQQIWNDPHLSVLRRNVCCLKSGFTAAQENAVWRTMTVREQPWASAHRNTWDYCCYNAAALIIPRIRNSVNGHKKLKTFTLGGKKIKGAK